MVGLGKFRDFELKSSFWVRGFKSTKREVRSGRGCSSGLGCYGYGSLRRIIAKWSLDGFRVGRFGGLYGFAYSGAGAPGLVFVSAKWGCWA